MKGGITKTLVKFIGGKFLKISIIYLLNLVPKVIF
jgi:hypothetical protein